MGQRRKGRKKRGRENRNGDRGVGSERTAFTEGSPTRIRERRGAEVVKKSKKVASIYVSGGVLKAARHV